MGKKSTTPKVQTGVTVSVQTNTVMAEEKKFSWGKFILVIILLLSSLSGGVFLGRKSIVEQPPVYIPGDTVFVDLPAPEPVEVIKPCDTVDVIKACVRSGKYAELFPSSILEKIKYIEVPTREDTVDIIINDWATERVYNEKIFDVDTLGTATVKARVQYNRISSIEAEVIPVIKEVGYIVPPKKIIPAVGAGINTKPAVMIEGGVFFKDKYGAFLMYERDWVANKNYFGISGMYKF